jgi:N-acetylmuramoyl-L-alanine amidase
VYIEKKPTGWENKLASANARVMTIVYNIKQGCLATARFLRKHTTQINGKTEFASTGRSHQLLRIHFESDDAADPAGAGTYFLSSKNFEKKPICCVSTTAQRTGFDLLREHYAGQSFVCVFAQVAMLAAWQFQSVAYEIGVYLRALFSQVFLISIINYHES